MNANAVLEAAVTEMERRYQVFRAAGVANLARFNAAASPDEQLPALWIYREIVSSTVQRLGVMARAPGIFLVFAAQRPEDRVMPVQLRDNLGNRLVLRVESPGTSMIALPHPASPGGRGGFVARAAARPRAPGGAVARRRSRGLRPRLNVPRPILPAEQMAAIVGAIRG